jgi:hypothetical protein
MTKTYNWHTRTHHEHNLHTDSSHSKHKHEMHHNSTKTTKDYVKDLKTYTYMTAATTMTDSTAVYSEESYLATDTTMTDSTSSESIVDVTMTGAFGTGLITASVSAEDFTISLSDSYIASTAIATAMPTPPYNYQPSYMMTYPSASMYASSAGFATTSQAVFTGSGGRKSVDYLLVAVLPALVGMAMWV